MEWDEDIDARGLLCPLPVLKARKQLNSMDNGAVLRLTATDPASVVDVPHFCAEGGHDLVNTTTLHGETPAPAHVFLIRKGPA
ncbi:MAG: sulfurtransferase TusA family protein [Sediminimonas qiaohouensis]|uniref:Sulfurtransferase TusA family protein n=1 Tax=Sediminimonas qiaohouensis TaxID=552061 RepID=A0A7C9LQ04_9RHOB|nr:sulfurtransferase TusA family protein [Sediminimonas qiaohouensis]MTJ03196.1 sulfurtransferase TusA family protein [Sediminimonas qiaohouensis]